MNSSIPGRWSVLPVWLYCRAFLCTLPWIVYLVFAPSVLFLSSSSNIITHCYHQSIHQYIIDIKTTIASLYRRQSKSSVHTLSMTAAFVCFINIAAIDSIDLRSVPLTLFAIKENAPFSGYPINPNGGGFGVTKPADPWCVPVETGHCYNPEKTLVATYNGTHEHSLRLIAALRAVNQSTWHGMESLSTRSLIPSLLFHLTPIPFLTA